jgi:hypothetical protein
MSKFDIHTNVVIGSDRAYCHDCTWDMIAKRTVGLANRTLGAARRHAESKGHTVEVVREDTRWFRPLKKDA